MGDSATFNFDLTSINIDDNHKIGFKPTLDIQVNNVNPNFKRLEKTSGNDGNNGSINVFKLREIYETHSDIVEEIYAKFDENSPFYIKSISMYLKKLDVSEDEFYRFHFNNYYNTKDFNQRPLAKLNKDIYNKLKNLVKE